MTGTPRQAVDRLRQAAAQLREAVEEATRENLQDALDTARLYSSGPYSTADLRRLGHPYARRNPRPPLPPEIINIQSGQFIEGWRVEGPTLEGSDLKARLVNETPHAELLKKGTARMIARPIEAAVEDEIRERVNRRLAAAIAKSLRG